MQSYLTDLWNRSDIKSKERENEHSFCAWAKAVGSWILFSIAFAAATYWYFHDSTKNSQRCYRSTYSRMPLCLIPQ